MDKKENKPEQGKQYRPTGAKGTPCIAKGNTWAESEVEPDETEKRIQALEDEGLTRGDAQGVVMAQEKTLADAAMLGLTIEELKELREVVSLKCEKGRHQPAHWDRHELHRRLKIKLDDLLAETEAREAKDKKEKAFASEFPDCARIMQQTNGKQRRS